MSGWKVRPVRGDEFDPWAHLFQGYADFYQWPTSVEHQRTIWRWIHDERSVEALAVRALHAQNCASFHGFSLVAESGL